MTTAFVKMHGLGNDFAVLQEQNGRLPSPDRIRELADRRSGIGFDQLLWVESPRLADTHAYYRIFNVATVCVASRDCSPVTGEASGN